MIREESIKNVIPGIIILALSPVFALILTFILPTVYESIEEGFVSGYLEAFTINWIFMIIMGLGLIIITIISNFTTKEKTKR